MFDSFNLAAISANHSISNPRLNFSSLEDPSLSIIRYSLNFLGFEYGQIVHFVA